MSNKLSDIVDFNPSRILKKGTVAPFIEMASLPTNTKFIKQTDEKPFSGGSKFKNGDTLFARITPCLENGKTGKVTNLKDEIIGHGSTEFIVMSAKEPEFDEDYIYYFARLPEFREFAQQRMVGTSGRQRVAWQDLAEFEFIFPPKEQRKKAAALLNIYDQKIDLNTQINQTLEQIAQALFKSWFVDFDPVRAKVQALSDGLSLEQAELAAMQAISGKTPEELTALSQTQPERYAELAETAKAFPCEIVEVDGVEVPKGWGKTTLSEICEMQNGYAFKSSEWTDSGIPVIKIGSIQSKILTVEGNGFVSEDNLSLRSNFVLNDGDIVIGLTGAYVGKVGRMPANKRAMLNQRVAKFLAKQINESETFYSFIYMNVIQEEFKNFVDFTAQGSAQPNISTKDILKYPLLLANNDVHLAFEKLLKKILDKSIFNSYQNEILSNSRDLLLPKLLNGEV
ncbi:restriction endonuclease subunit S [Haemophilus influenzae]|uniref:restriction endonuclease subunit S n=1 Tax=Haemophilus influenzae TaxID=727 RepID=UPI000E0D63B6|nr:restriction endonuclease subunit S [Haemophilus influenzae]